MSAINKDGSLNMSLLERQIHEDMAIYSKSRAEDGMKKKALHSSETFETFQDFVSVSQLKAVPGSVVSSLFNGGSGPVSSFRNKNVHGVYTKKNNNSRCLEGFVKDKKRADEVVIRNAKMTESSDDKTTRSSNKTSRDRYKFLAHWKRHCSSSASDTLSFMLEMEELPETICQQHFVTDIDSDVVGDVVNAMHLLMCTVIDKYNARNDDSFATTKQISSRLLNEPEATQFIRDWLKAMANCGRFDLSLSFLTTKQTLQLKEIVRFVTNSIHTDETDEASMNQYNKILKS